MAGGAVRVAAGPVGHRRDGVGAERRDGFQPARRRPDGCAQSTHGDARDSARCADASRRDDLRDRVVNRARVCGVPVEPYLRVVVAGRAGNRVLVFAREALHLVHAGIPGPGDGRRSGRRLARGRWSDRRPRALAARPGDRSLGWRLRYSLRLPGRRVRSRARPQFDSRPLRHRAVAGHFAGHACRHRDLHGVARIPVAARGESTWVVLPWSPRC